MCHVPRWIVLALAAALAACASATAPDATASVAGDWIAVSDTGYFRLVTLSVTERADRSLTGTVRAWLRAGPDSIQPGYIIAGQRDGRAVVVTITLQSPVGADFSGTIANDGTLPVAVTRINRDRPQGMRLTFRRP